MHDSKLIFVRTATFGQLIEQIFDHESWRTKTRKACASMAVSVRICRGGGVNVDNNQGQDHFLEVNLINGTQAFGKIVPTMSFPTFIFQLLNHRTVRSQQVRITLNKFRPFKAPDDLWASLWIIIHPPDYEGKAGGHGMLFARRRRRKMDRIWFPYHLGCEKPV
jgi:hypothetical protein